MALIKARVDSVREHMGIGRQSAINLGMQSTIEFSRFGIRLALNLSNSTECFVSLFADAKVTFDFECAAILEGSSALWRWVIFDPPQQFLPHADLRQVPSWELIRHGRFERRTHVR